MKQWKELTAEELLDAYLDVTPVDKLKVSSLTEERRAEVRKEYGEYLMMLAERIKWTLLDNFDEFKAEVALDPCTFKGRLVKALCKALGCGMGRSYEDLAGKLSRSLVEV